ncbi:type II secretion system F family protein [Thermodesulfovibrionales bacterium]|nr:type II secretion system F family protein [Thermodesulfovibrionales bacterium]
MATAFRWTGKTFKGSIQKGEMTADSRDEVVSSLRRQGIFPTIINEARPVKEVFKDLSIFKPRKQKITDKNIVVFTRQFATMFTAGIPIVQGLDILAKQADNKTFGSIIAEIKSDVEAGATLADALRMHPKIFDSLYVNLVAAGEAGGVLDTVLRRLANYIEMTIKLKRKVKGAMYYPVAVMGVAVLVVSIIMIWVIPVFAEIFEGMGIPLPLPTRIVITISNFIGGIGGLAVLGVLVSTIIGIRYYRGTEKGSIATDRLMLKIPVIGDLVRKVAVARFTRTLGTLLSSGVPILDGLDICARVAGNKVIEEVVLRAKTEVATGKTVADPLSESEIFPPMVVQMIEVGESTGTIDQMLAKIADFYDDEVDNSVTNLTTLLEPAMIIFLGVTIGFIVVALYMPIFKMGEVVGV